MMDSAETIQCVQQLIVEIDLPANLVEAGARKEDGHFTQRSINAQVVKRLRELTKAKA